jgi:hypothetical protein
MDGAPDPVTGNFGDEFEFGDSLLFYFLTAGPDKQVSWFQ